MALKIFELQEQCIIDTFLIKLTQFEKTGKLEKNLFRWKIWKLKSTFEINQEKMKESTRPIKESSVHLLPFKKIEN